MTPVTIIGAGWSGLAAAVELSRHNIPVTIYESARHIGGRARDVELDGATLDNGQHLIIGAYRQLLALLNVIGVKESDVFLRTPQHIRMLDVQSKNIAFELKLPQWPAPFNLLGGILNCPSLTWQDKLKTLWRFNALLKLPLMQDNSVTNWLEQANLPPAYADYLLKPLCLAALTTHVDKASARIFQTVLQQTFTGPRTNTDLLIAKTTLGQLFPAAAKKYIESHGGCVLTNHKVTSIDPDNKTLLLEDKTLPYQQLILATPSYVTSTLLQPHPDFTHITNQLTQLKHDPICTIYLQYPPHVRLPLPMLGCINATSEWLFDRVHCKQPGLISVIISADGTHMSWPNDLLINKVTTELAQLFTDWPAPVSAQVIREKRAGFCCTTGVDSLRPSIRTSLSTIKLCGDYVYAEENSQPGLPATLEGAVRCGVKCAQQTLQDMQACNT